MKVSVIGNGKVGSTVAFALSERGFVRDLVMVGRRFDATMGDALDIAHAQPFVDVPTNVIAGSMDDTGDSDIIVMCASVPSPRTITDRASLGSENVRLMRELLLPLSRLSPKAVLVMVSNPVDVLTYFAREFSGYPAERVIGSGTLIDSARLRHELSLELGIHCGDLRAYVLGEHGGSQFAAMSCATAGGESFENTPRRREVIARVVNAGFEIRDYKGYTNYGIALATAAIVEAIARDARHTMPVSVAVDGFLGVRDVCLSLPAVVGRSGVQRILRPELNAGEQAAFLASADVVRGQIEAARRAL